MHALLKSIALADQHAWHAAELGTLGLFPGFREPLQMGRVGSMPFGALDRSFGWC